MQLAIDWFFNGHCFFGSMRDLMLLFFFSSAATDMDNVEYRVQRRNSLINLASAGGLLTVSELD